MTARRNTKIAFLTLAVLAEWRSFPIVVRAQEPVAGGGDYGGLAGRCINARGEDCDNVFLANYLDRYQQDSILQKTHDEDEEEWSIAMPPSVSPERTTTTTSLLFQDKEVVKDPQLKTIPGTDFEAYVRADISSFYQEAPGSRSESTPKFRGQAGKFINMSPNTLDLWWDGPNGPVRNDRVQPWASGGTGCYPSHHFIFTQPDQPDVVVCRITIVPGVSVYYCDPFLDDDEYHTDVIAARGQQLLPQQSTRSLDRLSASDQQRYQEHVANLEFGVLYKNFTGGSEWLTMYPKSKPQHFQWRADHFGQEHVVTTPETHLVVLDESQNDTSTTAVTRRDDSMNLTLKAASCAPRAFEIEGFLSEYEVDHLLDLVHQSNSLKRSTTNGHLSSTRTSSTTWLARNTDEVVDTIFRRVANVLQMDEAQLRGPNRINEDLQIVHYDVGQEYQAHHDFSMPKGLPDSPSRSINLCMYLNDVPAGGETAFPRWRNAETDEPIKVKPQKGKALLFYMVNPDGNLDDLTQHAALPVLEGEKYFANLWIHDPHK